MRRLGGEHCWAGEQGEEKGEGEGEEGSWPGPLCEGAVTLMYMYV